MTKHQNSNLCCKICGNTKNHKLYNVKERRLNEGEYFQYLYCSECGTLQLNEKVEDLGRYYGDNYYSSFYGGAPKKKYLPMIFRKCCSKFITNCTFWLPTMLEGFLRYKVSPFLLYGTKVKLNSAILDVGGGDGRWLSSLSRWGFTNLTCIDKFCPDSPHTSINFIQCDFQDMDASKQYDCIIFNHSFEHMQEPRQVLAKVKKLLRTNGVCLIRIPVCECEAWNMYKEHWYQIDAPRHYFLYTERALRKLCAEFDLQICKVIYDSGLSQLLTSEYYKNTNLSLKEIQEKTKQQEKSYKKIRNQLNKSGRGDQAAFYIRHSAVQSGPKETD